MRLELNTRTRAVRSIVLGYIETRSTLRRERSAKAPTVTHSIRSRGAK